MIVDPRSFINDSFEAAELQKQPAGLDLTVESVEQFVGGGTLDLDNSKRQLPPTEKLYWKRDDDDDGEGHLLLHKGSYLVNYAERVEVPEGAAGMVLPRSSLMRMGAMLHSALWDPGYEGKGYGLLVVYQPLRLHRRARIGQLVLFELGFDPEESYSGQYQGENLD